MTRYEAIETATNPYKVLTNCFTRSHAMRFSLSVDKEINQGEESKSYCFDVNILDHLTLHTTKKCVLVNKKDGSIFKFNI